ncbi:MAG: hypothetical protein WBP94_08170 [Rhodomicrobiaceae bacterium]
MRFLVVVISAGAALTLIVASGLMNWVFMSSLGRSEFERQILGAVSVAVSAFIALLPTLLLWARRARRTLYLVLGVPVFLAFAAFSLSSAVGFAAKTRGSLSEDRAVATARLAEVRHEVDDAETRRNALGALRPFAVLQDALRGLEQDRHWQSSKACEDATVDASRAFCKTYFDLKAEAARASEAARLDERLNQLRSEADRLEAKGAGLEDDNQAAVLARILGLQAAKVERGLTLFLAVLVEIGAALGLYFATGPMRPAGAAPAPWRRGALVIEGEVVKEAQRIKPARAALKQIPTATPRRVPRLSRS